MMGDRIEWTFSPAHFFEGGWLTAYDGVKIDIHDGRVTAALNADQYDGDEGILDRLHCYIEALFQGGQLENYTEFSLSPGERHREHLDRGRHVTIFDEGHGADRVDIKVIGREGNLVRDTRAERIDRQRQFAKTVAELKSRDPDLDAMLASHRRAVENRGHELVHLYEVRDALATKFHGEDEACRILRFDSAKWKRLGRLANGRFRQGRHGGGHRHLGDASPAELEEARAIAKQMIVAYMKYLRRCGTGISAAST